MSCLSEDRESAQEVVNVLDQGSTSSLEAPPTSMEDDILDFKAESVQGVIAKEIAEGPMTIVYSENEAEMVEATFSEASFVSADHLVNNSLQLESVLVDEPIEDAAIEEMTQEMTMPKLEENISQVGDIGRSESNYVENTEHQMALYSNLEVEASKPAFRQKDQLSNEKLKKILRKWKEQALIKRETREQKLYLASVALSSLSLGPPIRLSGTQTSHATGNLDIDQAARKRYSRWSKSWSRLNVSEVVAATLSARNPYAKCICWKLVVYIQEIIFENHTYDLATKWLHSKLLGSNAEDDYDELVLSSPNLSIWKKWIAPQISPQQTCCLPVIRSNDWQWHAKLRR
ncbi:hypothetical protein J5N97_013081 [Dioscorea zingiberensis]|uniref:Uncharacterized protein n=1 Tax=Dioscorea zingiberensis TaxID=325984 RepID=A0A9D5CSA5_9LILI|nr:hypothetical protein J5N97_013081 [Dioscorea zingiberensis]